jgi:peptide/nickel transport system substrate-binding protein
VAARGVSAQSEVGTGSARPIGLAVRKRLSSPLAAVSLAIVLVGVPFGHAGAEGATDAARRGGVFRLVSAEDAPIDPAVGFSLTTWMLLKASCAQLLNNPDRPSPAGLRVVPEVAAGPPRVSANGKVYRFTIRRGSRFSNGAPVTAQSFVRAFVRALAPSMGAIGKSYLAEVVGVNSAAEGVPPTGIVARGNRLTIRLTRPVSDFAARMTLPFFCAVPANLPIDPEGRGAPFHTAGPYFVSECVRGRSIVLRRNRYYRGPRPQHIERFVVDLQAAGTLDAITRVKAGRADYAPMTVDRIGYEQIGPLARHYGRNRSRFWVKPGLNFQGFFFNTRRGIFRNNVRLRHAVNFALDRPALVREYGPYSGGPHDQYLPPAVPGFRDARIYPLDGPNVPRARALARGHLRARRVVLYTPDDTVSRVQAQIVKRDLRQIALIVEVRAWPRNVHFQKLFARGEPWDLGSFGWTGDYPDPHQYLHVLFGRGGDFNPGFDATWYNRALARAARVRGAARYRAYGELDVRLAREAAPFATFMYGVEPTFVTRRVGCIVLRPELDLAAACLER